MLRPLALLSVIRLLLPAVSAQDAPPFDYRPVTVVVYNATSPESKEIAEHYMKVRGIPPGNSVGLKCSTSETITRDVYRKEVEGPMRAAFAGRGWWETKVVEKEGNIAVKTSVRVLVIIRGVPLRILEQSHGKDPKTGQEKAPQPLEVNAASVDSEFASLGVIDGKIDGPMNNPFFRNREIFAKLPLAPMFLTGRIDGPDKATALRLIDDAAAAEAAGGLRGRAYVDLAQKSDGGYKQGEDWLKNCASMLELKGFPTVVDAWAPTFPKNYPMTDAAVYFGWYTEHVDGPFLNPAFRFRKGAVACHIHSYSASTLTNPNGYWTAPLLARGAAFSPGNVWEPYLAMCPWLDVMLDRLLAGWTVAEAGWNATPALSWMTTMVGDPLYRPFPAAGGGDRKVDADYRALRLALQRWGGVTDREARFENLKKAAENLKSGTIYEYLALHAQAGEVNAARAAGPWLDLAARTYAAPADRLRVELERADALRRDGDKRAAMKVLQTAAETHAKLPEAEAAQAFLKQIREQP